MLKLNEFGFYRVYKHSKEIIETLLKDFFSKSKAEFGFIVPTIRFYEFDKDISKSKISIYRDWYQQIRSLPFVVISINRLEEKQLVLEQPPILSEFIVSDYSEINSSTGFINIGGAVDITTIITIGAEDADSRGDLIDLLFFFFTLYGKQLKVFTDPGKRSKMVFSIPKKRIAVSGEASVTIGRENVSKLFTVNIEVPIFIEYSYSMQIMDIAKFLEVEGNLKNE